MSKQLLKTCYPFFLGILLLAVNPAQSQTDPTLLFAKGIGNEYNGGEALAINAIKIDASGNRYVTGEFSVTADFDPGAGTANLISAGGVDIFLAKYDASGNYVWAKGMGGAGYDVVTSLALDSSGNVVVTGSFRGTADFDPGASTANLTSAGGQYPDIFLAKYDASGNYIWAKGMGGASYDVGNSLALDGSGNVVVTGYFDGTVDFDPGAGIANLINASTDIFLAKYDASGNYVWAKNMGGTSTDMGNSLALDGSGNLYVTGSFQGTADFDPGSGTANLTFAGGQYTDIFLAKYDASGNYVWAKRMGGTLGDLGNSLALDGSGNVVVTGNFNGTADFDPSSGTANLTSAGSNDIFLAKYDATGNYVWAIGMGGTGYDIGKSLALDGSGNAVVTGYFQGTADFDPSTGTANLTSAGSIDIFLAKYDASGNSV